MAATDLKSMVLSCVLLRIDALQALQYPRAGSSRQERCHMCEPPGPLLAAGPSHIDSVRRGVDSGPAGAEAALLLQLD